MTKNYGISTTKLTKKFGNITALDQVDLYIPRGKIVGLLGQNGAGKSTLVRLLSGVMKPTSGTAKINGFDLEKQKNQVKKITGLLPEEYALYEKLSIFEYIEFLGTLYDLNKEDIRNRFNDLATKLDIGELEDRLIDTLSKGQKQKVAIIAALIQEPEVVFLDEPLANLDVAAQRVVRKIIKQYKAENRTIIIATHLLSNVETTCDYIVVINKGRIEFKGDLDKFQKTGTSLEDTYLQYLGVTTKDEY